MAQHRTEVERINDPSFLVELAAGPPFAQVAPQPPGSGLSLGGQFVKSAAGARFIFKNAHMSRDDCRIFDVEGRLVAVSHHVGKNPYDVLDPLQLGPNMNGPLGEWESACTVTGYHGMPSFKIRPKTFSYHGRQLIKDAYSDKVFFNIAKQSRLKSMSIRHNLEVCAGEGDDPVYSILVDLVGRTMQIVNEKDECVAFLMKTTKALILNATLGAGSEMTIDIARGVDWTAIIAIVMGVQQVGKHFVKDAVSNFVVQPATNYATDQAFGAVGLGGQANQLGALTGQAMRDANFFGQLYNTMFA
eukprot:jgi/Chlat1/4757/Chrsp308S00820